MKIPKCTYIFDANYIMRIQTRIKSINQALGIVIEVFRIITNRECMDLSTERILV